MEVKELLSAYHDGELASDVHDAVAKHLESCPDCAALLGSFQQLSDLTEQLMNPDAPDQWAAIEEQLVSTSATPRIAGEQAPRFSPNGRPDSGRRRFASPLWLAAAATLLIAVGFGAYFNWPPSMDRHDKQLAATFGKFLNHFESDPQAAEQVLLASYEGEEVDLPAAAKAIGYQPAVARGLPPGYRVDAVYVLNMPCCKCTQIVCRRDGGGQIAVFEHEVDQPVWFGDRPAIEGRCCDKPTRIVEVDNNLLAATWRSDNRYITVIGARDVEEITQLVSHFEHDG
jgi:anti-sigma factor RsiW